MKKIQIILILVTALCFSCKQVAQPTKKTAFLASQYPELVKTYKSQQHRFSVEYCKLYYNEKQVILDSTKIFDKLFGNDVLNSPGDWYNDATPILANTMPFFGSEDDNDRYIYRMSIQLNRDPNYEEGFRETLLAVDRDSLIAKMPLLKGYLLIDGILVNRDTKIEDFNALRKKEKLPLFTQSGSDIRSQGIIYDVSYCKPVEEMPDDYGYTEVFFLYNQEDEFEETHRRTNIFQFRYNYSYTRPKRN